jgi:hypothetical protein
MYALCIEIKPITSMTIQNCEFFLRGLIRQKHHEGSHEGEYARQPIFDSKIVPNISISDYIQRIIKFSSCSMETIILACIYIDYLSHRINLTEFNIHRVILTSIVIASKFHEDKCAKNSVMAKIGGITAHDLMEMEISFLDLIQFDLNISREIYDKYSKVLI